MIRSKQVFCVLLFTLSAGLTQAQSAYETYSQNNTNSPYTRYGYGQLADQLPSNSKAMGGIAYAIRDGLHVNSVNPASYTAVDSLTFLFEGSYTLQNLNLSDGAVKKNAKNSSFDYVAMQFRLRKGMGFSLGFLPYSYVGYNVSEAKSDGDVNSTVTYLGNGGLQQVYAGLGANILPNLSIGANISYLWGETNRLRKTAVTSVPADSYIEEMVMEVNDFKLDFGAQYQHRFNRKHSMIVGAVFSPSKKLNNDTYIITSKGDYHSEAIPKDTVATSGIPMKLGFGVSYNYAQRLTLGADYSLQKWSDVSYINDKGGLSDMSRISVGMEYLPSYTGRSFFSHIKYRLGAYYSTPYYKIKDADTGERYRASREYGVTAGFAIPVPKVRSVVNISAQYSQVNGQRNNTLDEKYLKLTIGITFNERWFVKRKVD